MKKSAISPDPGYFKRYIDLMEDRPLAEALAESTRELEAIDAARWVAVGDRTYAPGKWTLQDILQHVIDTERVFGYRALRFARHDGTPLAGFDQEAFARHTLAARMSVPRLLEEWKVLRAAHRMMFEGFDEEMLCYTGTANQSTLSALAIGFLICGHQRHHLRVLEAKYLPLAAQG